MGTVSRVHTFASGAILTAAQLNNEFDNLLTSSAINGGLDATNLGVTAGQATASKALVVDSSRNLADATGSNRINNLALSGTFESTGAITASAGITSGGNIVSDTDSTDDLGTTGVRWANLFVDDVTVTNNVTIGGTLTLTGGITLNGNTTIGDSSADTLSVNSSITSNLIFTDNTYDIGASGATRPRDLFLSRNAVMGGTLGVTGATTLSSTLGVTGLITASGGVSGTTGTFSGDVAIGAASAGNKLDIITGNTLQSAVHIGEVDNEGFYISSIADTGTYLSVGAELDTSWYARATSSVIFGGEGGAFNVWVDGSLTDGSTFAPTNRLTLDSSGDLAVGTDKLYVDVSASAVGVGTSSPAGLGGRSLNIKAPTANGADLTLEADNGTNFGVLFSGATTNDPFSIYSNTGFKFATASDKNATGFSEKMRLTSAGLLGLGTTSPQAMLDTTGVFRSTGGTGVPSTGTGAEFFIDSGVAYFQGYNRTGSAFIETRLRGNPIVLDGGSVGIGTSSPTKLLTVYSATNDEEVLRVGNAAGASGSTQGITYIGITPWNSGTHAHTRIGAIEDNTGSYKGALTFDTRGAESDSEPTERMRIASGGQVIVGTNGVAGDAFNVSNGGAEQLEIGTSSGYANFQSYNRSTSAYIATEFRASEIRFDTGSSPAERARITGDGITFNGDTSVNNALSDYEQGTHNPSVGCSTSGSMGLNSSRNTLQYTKIGKWVNVQGYVEINSVSSGVGHVALSMPFANQNDSEYSGVSMGSIIVSASSNPINCDRYALYMQQGLSSVSIYATDGSTLQNDSAENITTAGGADLYLNISYRTQ